MASLKVGFISHGVRVGVGVLSSKDESKHHLGNVFQSGMQLKLDDSNLGLVEEVDW